MLFRSHTLVSCPSAHVLLLPCCLLHAFLSLHTLPLSVCRCALLRNTSYPSNRVYMLVLPMSPSPHASPAFFRRHICMPCISISLSLCLLCFLCLSFLFFYLLIHHIRHGLIFVGFLLPLGFASTFPRHHLIDSSFLLVPVRSRLE